MLHTVNKSPFERTSLETCLRLATKGNAILLIEDGVLAAIKGTAVAESVEAALKEFSVYALGPDLDARGIGKDQVIDGIGIVDYGGFVDLAVEHGPVQAWL